MSTIVSSRLDSEGVLRLTLPLGPALADHEVEVRIVPKRTPTEQAAPRARLRALAGSIDDPAFRRPEQLPLETRTPFE